MEYNINVGVHGRFASNLVEKCCKTC